VTDLVLVDAHDRIATITLNRPEARNALSSALLKAMTATLREAQGDAGIDVIILTGADPAFCAGLDLKELGGGNTALAGTRLADDTPIERRGPLPPGPKPVIGAINGAAITGGFELALACDFLVASDRARFADTHARVGIQPWWGLSVLLPQAIGLRRAREMSATGNFIDAQRALDWGLVNHVVPHEDLLSFTRGLAADVASTDQAAMRQVMATYTAGSQVSVAEAWLVESEAAAAWQGRGLDAAEIERRRQQVVERGRGQL
jgi:enoyl-CoA hydratase